MDQSKKDEVTENNKIIDRNREYSDLATVESQKDDLLPEEFPEGPYGSPIQRATLGKDGFFLESQRATSAFTYEDKAFHEGLERQDPNSHPTHDEKNQDE